MDFKVLQKKLGMTEETPVLIRKAQELQRLSNVRFDSASFGVGDICKSILCFELACTALDITFDRYKGIRLSGLSEKAYTRSFNAMQNALGLRKEIDVRQLAVQFGCVRMIETVRKALIMYKQRFIAALPEARRSAADFGRPVFIAVAFFLCAKKFQLKVDKKEKKDSTQIKSNRELLDVFPDNSETEKADRFNSGSESEDGEYPVEVPGLKRSRTSLAKAQYKEWKSKVIADRATNSVLMSGAKRAKQTQLSCFSKMLN